MTPSFAFILIASLLAADPPIAVQPNDFDQLQGTWIVTRARRGVELDDSLVGATVTFAGAAFNSRSGNTVLGQGTWHITQTRKPKSIDLEYTEGPDKGRKLRGVYQLNEDRLVLLFGAPGKARPSSLEAGVKEGQLFLMLKFQQANAKSEEARKESEQMQGVWTVTRARRGPEIDKGLMGATVTLVGDEFTSRIRKTVLGKGVWTIGPAATPKTIDLEFTQGEQKGQKLRGIYRLDEDRLVVLFGSAGQDRPSSFEAKTQPDQLFLILKLEHPNKDR
jgi:uncharacterized protein (TIGR03067 family)